MQVARKLSAETYAGGAEILFPERVIRSRPIPFANYFLLIFFIFGLVFTYVYQQALVAQNSIDISQIKSAVRQQKTINEKLKVQDTVLQSPGRLEQLATASLGMIKPETANYIVIPAQSDRSDASKPRRNRGILASLQVLWRKADIWR